MAGTVAAVYIRHPRPADLIIALQAPDGTYYRLHTNTATGVPGINNTYTVNASAELRPGNGG